MKIEKTKSYFEDIYNIMNETSRKEDNLNEKLGAYEQIFFDQLTNAFLKNFKKEVKEQTLFALKEKEIKMYCDIIFALPKKLEHRKNEIVKNACEKFNTEFMPNCGDIAFSQNYKFIAEMELKDLLIFIAKTFGKDFLSLSKRINVIGIKFDVNQACVEHMFELGKIIKDKNEIAKTSQNTKSYTHSKL